MTTETDKILQERGETHGDVGLQSTLFRELVRIMSASPLWYGLPAPVWQSLMMDALKTSRILAGNPYLDEHWNDKIGYAQLALDHIRRSREK